MTVTLSTVPLVGYRLFVEYHQLSGQTIWQSLYFNYTWTPGKWETHQEAIMTPNEWHVAAYHPTCARGCPGNRNGWSIAIEPRTMYPAETCAVYPESKVCPHYTANLYCCVPEGHWFRGDTGARIVPGFFAIRDMQSLDFFRKSKMGYRGGLATDYRAWRVEMKGTVEEYKDGYRVQSMRMVEQMS